MTFTSPVERVPVERVRLERVRLERVRLERVRLERVRLERVRLERVRLERVGPDLMAGEREALTQQLDFHRATLLMKLDGLDDEQVRRPGTPSGLSLLGLVKHLAVTEHGWFVIDFAGLDEPDLYDPDDSFRVEPGEAVEELVGAYLTACERAREITAKADLDDACTTPWGERANLRAILVHMIEETARHNGHADVIRESIDGSTGL